MFDTDPSDQKFELQFRLLLTTPQTSSLEYSDKDSLAEYISLEGGSGVQFRGKQMNSEVKYCLDHLKHENRSRFGDRHIPNSLVSLLQQIKISISIGPGRIVGYSVGFKSRSRMWRAFESHPGHIFTFLFFVFEENKSIC